MKKVLGAIILIAIFTGLFVMTAITEGLFEALFIWVGALVITGLLILGLTY